TRCPCEAGDGPPALAYRSAPPGAAPAGAESAPPRLRPRAADPPPRRRPRGRRRTAAPAAVDLRLRARPGASRPPPRRPAAPEPAVDHPGRAPPRRHRRHAGLAPQAQLGDL